LEVQLRDLVVDNEYFLVRKLGERALQAQQRIEPDVVPVVDVVGVVEAFE
nr:hypothetical protein [Tanacetum cinerariifolium]